MRSIMLFWAGVNVMLAVFWAYVGSLAWFCVACTSCLMCLTAAYLAKKDV